MKWKGWFRVNTFRTFGLEVNGPVRKSKYINMSGNTDL